MMIVRAVVKVRLGARLHRLPKDMDGLMMLFQDPLKKIAFSGHLFAFRGKLARIIKILFWNGPGSACSPGRIDLGGLVWP
jgi:transposase